MALGNFTGGRPGSSGRPGGGGGSTLAPSIIEYQPPAYDESQIRSYQQEALAPAVSGLRRVMREAQAGRYNSPSARREALRGATRGYGEALAPLQVGAGAQARQRYDIQYQQQIMAERQRVAAEERRAELEYRQALLDEQEGGGAQSEPARPQYSSGLRSFQNAPPQGYNQVVGLGESSRRPLNSIPYQPYELTQAPATNYPQDWMA